MADSDFLQFSVYITTKDLWLSCSQSGLRRTSYIFPDHLNSPEYMLNVISFLKFPNYFLHNLKHKAEKVYYIYQHNMFGPL